MKTRKCKIKFQHLFSVHCRYWKKRGIKNSKCWNFFYVGTPSGVHLFNHLLWSIFQSSITHYIKQFLQVLTCFMVTFCGQLPCTASTTVFQTCGHYQNCIPCRFLLLSYDLWFLIFRSVNLNSSPEKTLSRAGIQSHDLRGTKQICYQLSYPGLDSVE